MDREEKLELALRATRAAHPRASGWYRGMCPFCPILGKEARDATFSVQVSSGHYHCFRCATGGTLDLSENPITFDGPPPDSDEASRPPEGFILLGEGDGLRALCAKPARDYLARRRVRPETVRRLGIGFTLEGKYAHRLVIPVKEGGAWRGFVCRDYTGVAEKPYRNAPGSWRHDVLYNFDALAQPSHVPCLLVEGAFDVLPYEDCAAAFLGHWTEEQAQIVAGSAKRPVAVVLDGDTGDSGWGLAMRLRLDGLRAGAVRLPPKTDPDQVPSDWLIEQAMACVEDGCE